ncbi:MAG: class C beta-lactamase-related serine hydrolase [Sphingobacteriales bacterium]|nr:MAG: class C beta-lactamase-related serine hydrolase [Sphingobacteriales bacterium]
MRYFLTIIFTVIFLSSKSQTQYFPPLLGNTWAGTTPQSLGWCTERIDSLYNFLQQKNTKAFIVLKDGRIVLERYFGTFTEDSVWYWASAGKTITGYLVGKAQEQGYLSLSDTSAKYLGHGWTSLTPQQEDSITIRHQLTMTTGLSDATGDVYCTDPPCLQYLAPAGSRWAYHNAPYTLLEKVLTTATGQTINAYTQNVLKIQTGITGVWVTVDYNNVFWSKARSMARYGILLQNKFKWNNTNLLTDAAYVSDMLHTSQPHNYGYGYLTWLNGNGSYMIPSTQLKFPGSYAPSAPADMYAAIGKNGQILSVAPSKGLVVVRMGDDPFAGDVSLTLCEDIWQRLNYVMCNSTPPKTYTFIGSGNWSNAINWSNGIVPPAILPAGDQIVIYPLGNNECILNINQTIAAGAKFHVVANKKMNITGHLNLQ